MPALSSHDALETREWKQTVGQSGMTPTAFAFLIPVFVIVIFAPFLCVFCVRRRQRDIPPVRPVKKPALRRAEAKERLKLVTDVSNVTNADKSPNNGTTEEREQIGGESSSISERECAICLSTLHAPAPPEPALLSSQPTVDEAATSTSAPNAEAEAILKLQVCGHEFHAECLVSWFVLRKTTCPICRALYISKDDMQVYEDEEAAIGAPVGATPVAATTGPTTSPGVRTDANGVTMSNWRYFWRGESVWNRQRARGERGVAQGEAQEMARFTFFRHAIR